MHPRVLGFAVVCAAALAAPGRASAEYGWASHNAVLGGLGTAADFAQIDDPGDAFKLPLGFTVEAWVYLEKSDHDMTVVSKGFHDWELRITPGRDLKLVVGCAHEIIPAHLPLATWTHVAVTGDKISDAEFFKVYVDGVFIGSDAVPGLGTEQCPPISGAPVTIGASLDDPGAAFVGLIDEVRYWIYPRSDLSIRTHRFVGLGDAPGANAGHALTIGTAYTGLIASWTFNDDAFVYDHIGNHHGWFKGAALSLDQLAPPIPYNMALRLPGGRGDYVVVPDNPGIFNQTLGGTLDLWVHPDQLARTTLFSRGTAFVVGTDASGGVSVRFGASSFGTAAPPLAAGRWTHVAVTWLLNTAGRYTLAIYADGTLAATLPNAPGPFPVAQHDVWIGQAPNAPSRPFAGYLDEIRWWHGAANVTAIRRRMFSSGRDHWSDGDTPLAMWNFDGNLYSHVDYNVNGTLANGLANACRISGYRNESTPGPFGPSFHAHPTVLNRTRTPGTNTFASAYHVRAPNLTIAAGGSASDTITTKLAQYVDMIERGEGKA